jgi:alkylation response protein AidB-like acyl-CoA dehydrogenase
MSSTAPGLSLLDAVQTIAPIIRQNADRSERERRLSDETIQAMKRAGLFRMCTPRAAAGLEVDAMTALRVIEAVARIDASAGWNLFLSGTAINFFLWIPEEGFEEFLASGPDTLAAGAVNPPGKAIPVDGGYRMTGRWPFVSGCHSADWLLHTALLFDGDEPKRGEDGNPVQFLFAFPASQAEILDTWYTMGLCGTGSHDIVINDVFVPAKRVGTLGPIKALPKLLSGPLYRFTLWLPVASLAAVALGTARGAIDALLDLGAKKTPAYSASTVAGRASAQMQLGQAEAVLGAARSYLYESVAKAWGTASRGEMLTQRNKIDIQLAAAHALQSAAEVAHLVHQAAGASAIRREYAFERRFRDIHVLTQHAFASFNRFESVGKLLFGQPTDWPFLTL